MYRAFRMVQAEEAAFKEFWQKGQTATQGIERVIEFPMEITYQDVKYSFTVQRRGPDSLVLRLNGEDLIDAASGHAAHSGGQPVGALCRSRARLRTQRASAPRW